MVLLYRSQDLIHWDYLHLLCKGRKDELLPGKDPVSTGEMWECPDFFPLADKHALLGLHAGRGNLFGGRL